MASANPWDAVFDRVKVVREPNEVAAPLPTDKEVAAVEKELGHRLPSSYRAFAQRFGLHGECAGCYLLPISNPKTPAKALRAHTESRRAKIIKYAADNHTRGPHDPRVERVVFFTSGGSTEYAWDPTEPTDSEGREYRIYEYPVPEPWLQPGPKSFWELIEGQARAIDAHYQRHEEYHRQRGTPIPPAGQIRFQPFVVRKKQRPTTEELAAIKKWNGNTVQHLARTIREKNQFDVLLVLADALEEAGCTNADLIEACRSRFPEIDGEWALHTLGVRKKSV